jgi:hypothetical protein
MKLFNGFVGEQRVYVQTLSQCSSNHQRQKKTCLYVDSLSQRSDHPVP